MKSNHRRLKGTMVEQKLPASIGAETQLVAVGPKQSLWDPLLARGQGKNEPSSRFKRMKIAPKSKQAKPNWLPGLSAGALATNPKLISAFQSRESRGLFHFRGTHFSRTWRHPFAPRGAHAPQKQGSKTYGSGSRLYLPSCQLTWKCKKALSKRQVVFLPGSVHKPMLAGGRAHPQTKSSSTKAWRPRGSHPGHLEGPGGLEPEDVCPG